MVMRVSTEARFIGTLKVISMGTLVWTAPWLGAGETAVI
jgi:hypothetical protein